MKNSSVIVASLAGAAVGAGLALLFAPRKGKETRTVIKDFVLTHVPGIEKSELESLTEQITREINEIQ